MCYNCTLRNGFSNIEHSRFPNIHGYSFRYLWCSTEVNKSTQIHYSWTLRLLFWSIYFSPLVSWQIRERNPRIQWHCLDRRIPTGCGFTVENPCQNNWYAEALRNCACFTIIHTWIWTGDGQNKCPINWGRPSTPWNLSTRSQVLRSKPPRKPNLLFLWLWYKIIKTWRT